MNMPKPTALEKVSSGLSTQVALTAVGAAVGGVLAPLLPVLATTLAAGRQQQRVEATLQDIARQLQDQGAQIQDITDGQYQLINDIVLATLQTSDEAKLQYLRTAAVNAMRHAEMAGDEALILARVVRDISASEVTFLLEAFKFDGLAISNSESSPYLTSDGKRILVVLHGSTDAVYLSGLISLGLLHTGESTFDLSIYAFSRITARVIALLTR